MTRQIRLCLLRMHIVQSQKQTQNCFNSKTLNCYKVLRILSSATKSRFYSWINVRFQFSPYCRNQMQNDSVRISERKRAFTSTRIKHMFLIPRLSMMHTQKNDPQFFCTHVYIRTGIFHKSSGMNESYHFEVHVVHVLLYVLCPSYSYLNPDVFFELQIQSDEHKKRHEMTAHN